MTPMRKVHRLTRRRELTPHRVMCRGRHHLMIKLEPGAEHEPGFLAQGR
jgi:hypothetical protein